MHGEEKMNLFSFYLKDIISCYVPPTKSSLLRVPIFRLVRLFYLSRQLINQKQLFKACVPDVVAECSLCIFCVLVEEIFNPSHNNPCFMQAIKSSCLSSFVLACASLRLLPQAFISAVAFDSLFKFFNTLVSCPIGHEKL